MKILILGSNGFIGNNALKHFRVKYPDTFGCDVFAPSEFDDRFFLLNKEAPEFEKLFLQNSFDLCINASGSGSVSYSINNPEEDYNLNTRNVFNILNAISRFNTRCRFLNFSSAAVYGNPEFLPISEKSRTKPLSPYGFHKLISEQICSEYYHLQKINTCSMRVFSVYGEGLRKQLFWDIYQKTKLGPVVELSGTGEETRDFIFISDLINAIECIIEKASFDASVINVASGLAIPIREVAHTFLKVLGAGHTVNFSNRVKEGDPEHLVADISKIKGLGYTPQTNIHDGLLRYANWIKNNFDLTIPPHSPLINKL